MKKILSLSIFLLLIVALTSCKSNTIVTEKVVKNTVTNEIIEEVEVEVPVYVDVDYFYDRLYEPGTYFKVGEFDEGVALYTTVVIDEFGYIAGVQIDKTASTSKYKYDSETETLYLFVDGITDEIPDTYRKVTLGEDLPNISDSITTLDLIVGYPEHNSIIESLINVNASETQNIYDFNQGLKEDSWTYQMNLLSEKIVNDQTTYGINQYLAGSELKTSVVAGVSVSVGEELALVQDVLNNEAKLKSNTVLELKPDSKLGFYTPGSYYGVSSAKVLDDGVSFNTAFVVVDDYGQIAGVKLDETFSNDGLTSTKWINEDDFWLSEVSIIEEAILLNQGSFAFEFIDEYGKTIEFSDLFEIEDEKFENLARISNLQNLNLNVNSLFEAYNVINEKALPKLQDGIYYNHDSNNFMSILVEDGLLSSITLDSVVSRDQAYISVDDEDFELYSYEKGSLDLSLEEERTLTYIYKDGDDYRHATSDINPDVFEFKDIVKFDYPSFDEKSTVTPVLANTTKQSLADRYGLSTEEGVLEWYEQIKLYTSELVGSNNPYVLNILSDGTTNTFDGITIDLNEYNKLLIDTMLMATDVDFSAKNIYLVSVEESDKILGNYKLADGSYYASSNLPNSDGGYYLLTMTVVDNKIKTIFLDETIVVDGELTTKSILDNEYLVSKNTDGYLEESKDSTKSYVSQIIDLVDLNALCYQGGELEILDDYDYELDTVFDDEKDIVKDTDALYKWNFAFESVLKEALVERVDETFENLREVIKEKLNDNFLVSSDESQAGEIVLGDLSEYFIIGSDSDEDFKIDFEINSSDKNLEIDEDDFVYRLFSEVDNTDSYLANINLEMSFDDYSSNYSKIEVQVLSNSDFKKLVLEQSEFDNIGLDFSDLLSASPSSNASNNWYDEFGVKLEYLTNTSTNSYVVTNYVPKNYEIKDTLVEVRTSFENTSSDMLSGSAGANTNNLYSGISDGKLAFSNGTNTIKTSAILKDNQEYTYKIDYANKEVVLNGTKVSDIIDLNVSDNESYPYTIFGKSENKDASTVTSTWTDQKVYETKIFVDGSLVKHFVPFLVTSTNAKDFEGNTIASGTYTFIDLISKEIMKSSGNISGSSDFKSYKNSYLLDEISQDPKYSLSRLGTKEDVNENLLFTLVTSTNVELPLAVDSQKILANFITSEGEIFNGLSLNDSGNSSIITIPTTLSDSLIVGKYKMSLVNKSVVGTITKTYNAVTEDYSYTYNNIELVLNDKEQVINESINEFLFNALTSLTKGVTYSAGTLYSATTDSNKIGEYTIKAYFDSYDQDEEYLYLYQKGETSRDFTYKVFGSEKAIKEAISKTSVGIVKDDLSYSQLVELSTYYDLEMNALDIVWSGKVDKENIPYFNAAYTPKKDEYNYVFKLLVDDGTASFYKYFTLNEESDKLVEVFLNNSYEIVTLGEKLDFNVYSVKEVDGDDSTIYTNSNKNSLIKKLKSGINNTNFISLDGKLYLNVIVDNYESKELELIATYVGGDLDTLKYNTLEKVFTVNKAYSDDITKQIESEIRKQFLLPYYIEKGEDVYTNGTLLDFDAVSLADNKINGITNVMIVWLDSNNRQIYTANSTPSGTDTLASVTDKLALETGDLANFKVTAVVSYEYEDKILNTKIEFETMVFVDR